MRQRHLIKILFVVCVIFSFPLIVVSIEGPFLEPTITKNITEDTQRFEENVSQHRVNDTYQQNILKTETNLNNTSLNHNTELHNQFTSNIVTENSTVNDLANEGGMMINDISFNLNEVSRNTSFIASSNIPFDISSTILETVSMNVTTTPSTVVTTNIITANVVKKDPKLYGLYEEYHQNQHSITLISPHMSLLGKVPKRFTCSVDQPRFPELTWSNIPTDTKSFVIMLNHYNHPRGSMNYWLVLNISPELNTLSIKNINSNVNKKLFLGKNDFKENMYKAPCFTEDKGYYQFMIYALDILVDRDINITKRHILIDYKENILATGELMVTN